MVMKINKRFTESNLYEKLKPFITNLCLTVENKNGRSNYGGYTFSKKSYQR